MKVVLLFISALFFLSASQNPTNSYLGAKYYPEAQRETDSVKTSETYLDNAKTYLTLSDILKSKYDYKSALEKIHLALSIYKTHNNRNGEFYCYLKIAELYRVRTFLEISDTYLQKAEHILKNHRTEISKANILTYYNRKAAIFSEYYNNQDSTLVYANRSLSLAKESKNLDMQFYSIMELGKAYEDKNNLSEALRHYEQALELAEQQVLILDKCDALVNIARVYHKNKALDLAIAVCNKGLELLKFEDYSFQKLLFYDTLQKIYEEKGDKEKAFDYLKVRLNLTDVYYANLYNDKMLEYESKYDVIEKENVLIKKNEQLAIMEQQLANEKAITINIVSVAILISLLIVVVILFYIKSRKKNIQLEKISNENEFLLGEANHRINNNLQLIIVLVEDELHKYANTLDVSLPLEKVLTKLEAISTLHRQLYKADEKNKIEINNYLMGIKQNFNDIFMAHKVQANFVIDSILLSTNTALYLGLLVTELCTNSLKHAFKEQSQKKIKLILNVNDNVLHFEYSDNGKTNWPGKVLKPKLVDKLCRQLKVNYKITYNNGFVFKFLNALN